jgi:hypothetical protein
VEDETVDLESLPFEELKYLDSGEDFDVTATSEQFHQRLKL